MRLKNTIRTRTPLTIHQKFTSTAKWLGILVAGIVGVYSIQQIQSTNLHSSPSCTSGSTAYELRWGSGSGEYNWTHGATSQSFSYVDGSETTFRFTYSGETSKLGSFGSGSTPNISNFFSGGTFNSLGHYATTGFTGGGITLTIDIIPAIPAKVAFDLYHINGDAAGGDKMTIYAVPEAGGANIYPTFVDNGTASWEDQGSGVVNAINISTTGNNAYVGVDFNNTTLIDQLVIVWGTCDICGAGVHGMGLGNIEFCSNPAPDNDGDNVADYVDIDDDNDGIPDHEEYCISSVPGNQDITVEIQLDGYPGETSWTLEKSASTVMSGGSYSSGNTLVSDTYSGTSGDYTFEIQDSYGDGLCCSNAGYYQIKVDGEIVVGPVSWTTGYSNTENFTVSPSSFFCIAGDPNEDDDYDGTPNYQDSDFCTLNSEGVCNSLDKDGDGVINSLDLDADNDGIPDIVEAGGADDDGDGLSGSQTDSDGDGLVNDFETAHGSTSTLFDTNGDGTNEDEGDFDGDNVPNWLDLDSDDDGIVDVVEAGGGDSNSDGMIDNPNTDTDNDGFADGVDGDVGNDFTAENTASALVVTSADSDNDGQPNSGYPNANMDGDATPSFLDIDADNDGIVDNSEAQPTGSYTSPDNSDADGDGIDDAYDDDDVNFGGSGLDPENTDASDSPDYLDIDSDNDTESDAIEGHDSDGDGSADSSSPSASGVATGNDVDSDGLDDGYDNNTAAVDPTNGNLSPMSFPIADAGTNRDWRSVSGSFPVEWLSFSAVWEESIVKLNWETASEKNSDYFLVEKKDKANDSFSVIGKINASGNSSVVQSYHYIDPISAIQGVEQRLLYRLRQVDLDGKFEYSNTVEILINAETLQCEIFPNPATETVTISVSGRRDSRITIKILNIEGKMMFEDNVQTSGFSQLSIDVDVRKWPEGIYHILVEDEERLSTQKLVVE